MIFLAAGVSQPDVNAALDHVGARHLSTPPIVDGLVLHEAHLAGQVPQSPVPVWIGGRFIPYNGPGTRYFEGMMNDSWRYSSVIECEAAAQAAVGQVPLGRHAGWYLTEEGDLSAMGANEALRQRYEWYLIDLMRRLFSIRPLPFAWSPWATGSVNAAALSAYRRLVTGVESWLATQYGMAVDLRIHFQDGVGAGHHTPSRAAAWGAALRNQTATVPVAMNLEHFTRLGNVFSPAPVSSIAARTQLYGQQSLPIGACWELRFWYPFVGYAANHVE
jgi:hypothetical protein